MYFVYDVCVVQILICMQYGYILQLPGYVLLDFTFIDRHFSVVTSMLVTVMLKW